MARCEPADRVVRVYPEHEASAPGPIQGALMRILLLSSAYNSLTQEAHVELAARGHFVGVATGMKADGMRAAVGRFRPDLILCPMLAQVIPRDLWEQHPCLILHPGIVGDRGGHSLDWAILDQEPEWGVTVVEAAEHVDSGPIWASSRCRLRAASKSSLYRDEIAAAAMQAMLVAVQRFENGLFVPGPLDYSRPGVKGRYRPLVRPEERAIDWSADPVATITRKIRSADGCPGLLDETLGEPVFLYGAHEEGGLIGRPGEVVAKRHGAICRAAVDGAVWITHLKRAGGAPGEHFKLPATDVLGDRLAQVPEVALPVEAVSPCATYRDIWYEERNEVGYVNFRFYNGAMGTDHCERLAAAVRHARRRPTKVIVLSGGRDFFSNGIHLNLIEAAADPAAASWRNINAMNDLVLTILSATDRLTITALYGSAGAGGVMLALAADKVLARDGIVLNPHYKGMGGLYGSEYWTYSLPKRVGPDTALELTESCLPVSVHEARAIGLIDDVILTDDLGESRFGRFREQIARIAEGLARSPRYAAWLAQKQATRARDESCRPLQHYRADELEQMQRNFWGADQSYHAARAAFVRKQRCQGELRWPAAPGTRGDRQQPVPAGHCGADRRAPAWPGWFASGTGRHAA
jgi:putative two-component system protein, hydrogenase maturation factor HypX/HoxX